MHVTFAASPGTPPSRFVSRDRWNEILRHVLSFTNGGGATKANLTSRWIGDVRWARNRPTTASDVQQDVFGVSRLLNGSLRSGAAQTNQLDTVSLRSAVQWAERMWRLSLTNSASLGSRPEDIHTVPVVQTYAQTHIWSDTTYGQTPEQRGEIVRDLVRNAERAGMLSAGYLAVEGRGVAVDSMYAPQTIAQCSLTVRDPEGSGSGWAGASAYDWARFDAQKLAEIALDKCLRSRHPVAIEPGRYTLIMEPQATYQLFNPVMRHISRIQEENFALEPFYDVAEGIRVSAYSDKPTRVAHTKIGQQLLDERITISHDPTDPALGVVPFDYQGDAYRAVTWFDKGVLTKLAYSRLYAVVNFHENAGDPNSGSYRMSGGTTSIDDMIATTDRGLIVTHFSGLNVVDTSSLLCTGVTRDGLWLIEKGKITKPVKNLRFTESPLFALNQVEQLGVPVPVFSPEAPIIVPPIKVRDFSFTGTIDAV
jgi:predicted Zn-dependent protease